MKEFTHANEPWFWNGFFGFFFQPVGPGRHRERIVHEGHELYLPLRQSAGYP